MTASKHYTMFTEKQTEQIRQKKLILTVIKVEKKLEVKGNGGFIFNT